MTPPADAPFLVSDDALAAVLRERAARTPATAETVVMARVHGEIARPRPDNLLALLPIGERAGSMSGLAGWGVAIAAAVIVIAVLGGRQPNGPASTPDISAIPPASLAAEPRETLQRLKTMAFALAVADGSLDGRLVLVDGELTQGTTACTEAACDPFGFVGLEDVPVDWKGPAPLMGLAYPAFTPFPGANDWLTGRFLVRPANGRLELLGRLVGDLSNPVSVKTALNDRRGYPNASSPFDILAVQGALTSDCEDTGSCAVAGPYLADTDSGRFGPLGGNGAVSVASDAFGLPSDTRIEGPFLVRFERVPEACPRLALCTAPGWGANPTLLGHYQDDPVVEVVLP